MGRLLIAAMFVVATVSAQSSGWQANPDVVARTAAAQPTFNYDEARVGTFTLPDVLAGVSTSNAWPARRAAILELFREHVYGRSPGRPEAQGYVVTQEDPRAMDGQATLRQVAVTSTQQGRSHTFTITMFLPNGRSRPAPLLLLLNNRPVSNTDATRREKSGFWPAEQVIGAGYAIAAIQNNDLAPDDPTRFREGVLRLFDGETTSARAPSAWGAIAAWAWGASRVMDYVQTEPRINPARVAVVGHSRGGKAALWAGAEDERFALVISNESGEGGAALSRRWYGETVARITETFPHWFALNYRQYAGRESALPVDQHMLLALVAPRAVYVASADEDLWSDPRGEYQALAQVSPVYALWKQPAMSPTAMPALERPLVVGTRGYHVRRGVHNLLPYDWAQFTAFADRVWR